MTSSTTEYFSDADLDRLEALLDADIFQGEAMLLDELQAMLCAVISGPEVVLPSVWLPVALGQQPQFESEAQANEVIGLLMAFYNSLVAQLDRGETADEFDEDADEAGFGLELILYPVADDAEELDFATWADAYIYGSQLGCNWYDAVGDHAEELTELLQPLFLLSGMLKEDAQKRGEAWLSPAQEQAAILSAEEDLPELVQQIHDFWRAKRDSDAAIAAERDVRHKEGKGSKHTGPGPAAETAAQVGQESCPCGSGQPYRQCCGSPQRLH